MSSGGASGYCYWGNSNTTGANDTTDKIFLVGAKKQSTDVDGGIREYGSAITYSNSNCYASGGHLYSNNTKVSVEGHTHSNYSTSDTKNTAGSNNNTTNTLFLIGAKSQTTGTAGV